jgi:hypothetical protein
MSKPSDALRAIGIFNSHGVLTAYADATGAEMPVAILYQPQEAGRFFSCATWVVIRPGFQTDPKSHWSNHGTKTFTVYVPKTDKAPKLEEAKAWVLERYGVKDFVSIPGMPGGKFPPEVATWLKKRLKEES